ncbi:MAG: AAC(3) family N-acetyltransferase [Crocinitomicaceae bacterium]|nr:AAC(3) family N-acetyltransferase [Crocinitomicaceae bacterium]
MRDFIRKIIPQFLLSWYRSSKKKKRNEELMSSRKVGNVLSKEDLIKSFKEIGIVEGDTLLVHSSLSKIGYVEEGPKTVVEALMEAVGVKGNILMPNSPNASLQLDYIKELKEFNVQNSPSKLGAISEYFRVLPNAIRSAHPTEPVSCIGPDADYFTKDHFGELTPYTSNSPFYRVSERGGKILYLGVTLDNAGTNLHTLEDAVDNFMYPVYCDEIFEANVKFPDGSSKSMKTKVHNPEQSAKRKCDGLIPLFIEKGVMADVTIGEARALLVDAKKFLDCMIEEYESFEVTMYTPNGVHH